MLAPAACAADAAPTDPQATAAWVTEIPDAAPGGWSRGQLKQTSGLGFDVGLAGWPQLRRRAFLDYIQSREGERTLVNCGVFDFGQTRTDSGSQTPGRERQTWCTQVVHIGPESSGLRCTVTRLSPAVLFETAAPALELFAGLKLSCDLMTKPESKETWFPRHVAFASGGQVVSRAVDGKVDLTGMSECWLLFWYGEQSPFKRLTLPNTHWHRGFDLPWYKGGTRSDFWAKGLLVPADAPMLVVLQRRPLALETMTDAVRLSFASGGVGAVSLVPISL